jgi:hypothetical protein
MTSEKKLQKGHKGQTDISYPSGWANIKEKENTKEMQIQI